MFRRWSETRRRRVTVGWGALTNVLANTHGGGKIHRETPISFYYYSFCCKFIVFRLNDAEHQDPQKNSSMKQLLHIILIFIFTYCSTVSTAQGKFAGSEKILIGKSYTDQKNIPWWKNYTLIQGSVISPVGDPVLFTANVYKKGNVRLLVFSKSAESNSHLFMILDVIEIKNFQPGWKLRTVDCDNGNEGATNIVALVQARKGKNDIVLKAWRCNMDKIRFDAMSTKLLHCAGDEQF